MQDQGISCPNWIFKSKVQLQAEKEGHWFWVQDIGQAAEFSVSRQAGMFGINIKKNKQLWAIIIVVCGGVYAKTLQENKTIQVPEQLASKILKLCEIKNYRERR